MHDLQDIINVKLHPIDNSNLYVKRCRDELQKNSILFLNNFLAEKTLVNLQREARILYNKAFYCSQNHNILLTEKNTQLDPINQTSLSSLEDATLMYLNLTISSIINSDHLVHPDSLDARNSLLLKTRI